MSALDDIVREGKVRFVGLSNFKLDEIEACMAVRRVDVVQYGWNMFDRRMQTRHPPVLRGARRRLHGVRLARVRAAHRHASPRTMDFGSADWRARQGKMGAIKMFAVAVRPGDVHGQRPRGRGAEGHRGPLRQEPPAARAALGDLAPGRQHRARRLPHRRRGRGQRRRDRLVDQRRRPRRDRRDLRPPRRRHRAGLLDRRATDARDQHGRRARGQGCDRHRRRRRHRSRDRRVLRGGGRPGRHRRLDAERGERLAAELGARPRSSRPTSATPTRCRRSSTSRSSGSAGSTSCATTPGSAAGAAASSTTSWTTSTR